MNKIVRKAGRQTTIAIVIHRHSLLLALLRNDIHFCWHFCEMLLENWLSVMQREENLCYTHAQNEANAQMHFHAMQG